MCLRHVEGCKYCPAVSLYFNRVTKRSEGCNLIQHPNVERLQRGKGLRRDKMAVHVKYAAFLLIHTKGSAGQCELEMLALTGEQIGLSISISTRFFCKCVFLINITF